MIDLVEWQTGYRGTVDLVPGIYEHAQMISARPGAPAHIIRVNADRRQYASPAHFLKNPGQTAEGSRSNTSTSAA